MADQYTAALDTAQKIHDRYSLKKLRTDRMIRLFVASTALLIRQARKEPERFKQDCATAGIKVSAGKRTEALALCMAAGGNAAFREPKMANCAAYLAQPPNGDPPPASLRDAERYIRRTAGGIRGLSDLYAAWKKGEEPEPPDLIDWADAELDGISADVELEPGDDEAMPLYSLALVRFNTERTEIWALDPGENAKRLRSAVKQVKRRAITENPGEWEASSIAAKKQKMAAEPLAESENDGLRGKYRRIKITGNVELPDAVEGQVAVFGHVSRYSSQRMIPKDHLQALWWHVYRGEASGWRVLKGKGFATLAAAEQAAAAEPAPEPKRDRTQTPELHRARMAAVRAARAEAAQADEPEAVPEPQAPPPQNPGQQVRAIVQRITAARDAAARERG
jgi:hypothetical protein